MKKQDRTPRPEVISREPFPNSKKVYVEGTIHPIKVAMREIALTETKHHGRFNGDGAPSNGANGSNGNGNGHSSSEYNPPVTVYDTSGPYTDPEVEIDVYKGLEALRKDWILDRGDVAQLDAPSSEYGTERLGDTSLDSIRFPHPPKPLVANSDKPVTQLYYARQGIITPEMEYIAIRENQRIDQIKELVPQHPGENFGARGALTHITP